MPAPIAAWSSERYQTVDCALDAQGVLLLVLNRPERLNAFTPVMCAELIDAFTQANQDDSVRAVLVTGAGRAFCAGMDLAETAAFGLNDEPTPSLEQLQDSLETPSVKNGVRDLGGQLTLAILACLKPVAAAINGPAVGIGATMTLAMDFRLACDSASIGFVFGRLGIVPEACSSWLLPRLVGLQTALEWMYAAQPFTAAEGLRGGLLRSLHTPDTLLSQARELLARLTRDRSPVGVGLMRQMLWRNSAAPDPACAHLTESLAMHWQSQRDGKEGVAAFLEKRPPAFTGRVSKDLPKDFSSWWTPPSSPTI